MPNIQYFITNTQGSFLNPFSTQLFSSTANNQINWRCNGNYEEAKTIVNSLIDKGVNIQKLLTEHGAKIFNTDDRVHFLQAFNACWVNQAGQYSDVKIARQFALSNAYRGDLLDNEKDFVAKEDSSLELVNAILQKPEQRTFDEYQKFVNDCYKAADDKPVVQSNILMMALSNLMQYEMAYKTPFVAIAGIKTDDEKLNTEQGKDAENLDTLKTWIGHDEGNDKTKLAQKIYRSLKHNGLVGSGYEKSIATYVSSLKPAEQDIALQNAVIIAKQEMFSEVQKIADGFRQKLIGQQVVLPDAANQVLIEVEQEAPQQTKKINLSQVAFEIYNQHNTYQVRDFSKKASDTTFTLGHTKITVNLNDRQVKYGAETKNFTILKSNKKEITFRGQDLSLGRDVVNAEEGTQEITIHLDSKKVTIKENPQKINLSEFLKYAMNSSRTRRAIRKYLIQQLQNQEGGIRDAGSVAMGLNRSANMVAMLATMDLETMQSLNYLLHDTLSTVYGEHNISPNFFNGRGLNKLVSYPIALVTWVFDLLSMLCEYFAKYTVKPFHWIFDKYTGNNVSREETLIYWQRDIDFAAQEIANTLKEVFNESEKIEVCTTDKIRNAITQFINETKVRPREAQLTTLEKADPFSQIDIYYNYENDPKKQDLIDFTNALDHKKDKKLINALNDALKIEDPLKCKKALYAILQMPEMKQGISAGFPTYAEYAKAMKVASLVGSSAAQQRNAD